MSSYALPAGQYQLGYADSSATVVIGSSNPGTPGGAILNNGTKLRLGAAANNISGAACPATTGAISAAPDNNTPGVVLDN